MTWEMNAKGLVRVFDHGVAASIAAAEDVLTGLDGPDHRAGAERALTALRALRKGAP